MDDVHAIINLITEVINLCVSFFFFFDNFFIIQQKFSDEIVHMISYMGSQQKKQLEGLEELAQFTSREVEMFMSNSYPFLLEQVHQNLAKATLASQWLNEDMAVLNNTQVHSQIISLSESLKNIIVQVCCVMAHQLLLCTGSVLTAAATFARTKQVYF